jgi:hypothetical protein
MTLRSFIEIDSPDVSGVEAPLRAKIEQAGGVIERCDSRTGNRGGWKVVITLLAAPADVMNRIVRMIEELPGVHVRSLSQHSRQTAPGGASAGTSEAIEHGKRRSAAVRRDPGSS